MTKSWCVLALLIVVSAACQAQMGGGAVYNQDRSGGAPASERAKRLITRDEVPPNRSSTFLDANVLMNVKADEYIAIFGISQESATLEEGRQKMDSTVSVFSEDVKRLGVASNDLFVDFVAQNRIYGFEIAGDVAKEKLTGFEVKKNVAVHYRSEAFLDKLLASAARANIYDLIKVDYIVKDVDAIHTRLMENAVQVVQRKAANQKRLLGVTLISPPQVYAERYSSYVPSEMYSSYVAQESEDVSSTYNRQRFVVQGARKARTFYFDALGAKLFDRVINPAPVEPVVQFTLYLKVLYEIEKAPSASARRGKGAAR